MSLVERVNRLRFEASAKGLRGTPPLARGYKNFAVLSMVQHKDLMAYLLAIKTFALRARPARIIVVADPSLDQDDMALLRWHVEGVEILKATDFQTPRDPGWRNLGTAGRDRGPQWRVLDRPARLRHRDPGRRERGRGSCVRRPFLRAASRTGRADRRPRDGDRRRTAEAGGNPHIQAMAEARLTDLPDSDTRRYVRGCSGFTGFGHGALTPSALDDLSRQMRALHGKRWDEWGSEQVASNLLAASSPDAFMLPYPRYCNADRQTEATVLTHYIGYVRFKTRAYELQARAAISDLARAPDRLIAMG
jgi:hypothetical protein